LQFITSFNEMSAVGLKQPVPFLLCIFFTIFILWFASFVAQPVAFTDNLDYVSTADKLVESCSSTGRVPVVTLMNGAHRQIIIDLI